MRNPKEPVPSNVGRMISELVTKVVVDSRAALIPAEQEHRKRMTETMMDSWEGEIGSFAARMLEGWKTLDPMPPAIKDILDRAEGPTHQTDFIINLVVAIAGSISVLLSGGSIVWQSIINELYADHRDVPLSPAEAAVGYIKGVFPYESADAWAALSGIDPTAFKQMTLIAGEAIGIEQAVALFRRGKIDQAMLNQVIAYSDINPAFYGLPALLSQEPMSSADAVETYIKGTQSKEDALNAFTIAGGEPSQFDVLTDTAGEGIGIVSALNLYNHGFITEETIDALIAYSRINPKWTDVVKLQRYKFLSPYQIVTALKAGDCTSDQATQWLLEEGYAADQVKAVVGGAASGSAKTAKNVTEAVLLDTYEAGLLSEAQFAEQMVAIGYEAAAVPIIIDAYNAKKILGAATTVITQIKKQVLAKQITTQTASGLLDQVGVQSQVRDAYLKDWAVEAQVEQKSLTAAQIGGMAKKGIVSYAYAASRWAALGYNQDDIVLLAADYGDASITIPVA